LLKVGTLNLQGAGENEANGFAEATKFDEVIDLMNKTCLDVLGLQETKRPSNDVFIKHGIVFVFASSISGKLGKGCGDGSFQNRANKGRQKIKTVDNVKRGKGKGKAQGSKTKGGKNHGKGKRKNKTWQ
jgi:hypothetical protein